MKLFHQNKKLNNNNKLKLRQNNKNKKINKNNKNNKINKSKDKTIKQIRIELII